MPPMPPLTVPLQPHAALVGHLGLVLQFVVSDFFIALAYFILSSYLAWMILTRVRRYKLACWGFCAFILCGGITHAMHVATIFHAGFLWCSALANDLTAAVAITTAMLISTVVAPQIQRNEARIESLQAFADHDEAETDPAPKPKKRTDVIGILSRSILPIVVTLGVQVGGYVWYVATWQARVATLEQRTGVCELALRELPLNYVPRVEHQEINARTLQQRLEDLRRLDRMETKIETLLERTR